jgi:hypothetical protein
MLSGLVTKLREHFTTEKVKEYVPPVAPQAETWITVALEDGSRALVTIPPAARTDLNCAYAFGIPKNGSTLLNDVFRGLSYYTGHTVFSLADELFAQGISLKNDEDEFTQSTRDGLRRAAFEAKGYFFLGFRAYPDLLTISQRALTRSVLLVRDPRDALVSHYFSVLFSHSMPAKRLPIAKLRQRYADTDINNFVTAPDVMDKIKQCYHSYEGVLPSAALILRYEDYVLNKSALVRQICTHLKLNVHDDEIAAVAEAVHKIPDREDPYSHVRKAIPGDHREKLQQKTITRLNREFASTLERYHYE